MKQARPGYNSLEITVFENEGYALLTGDFTPVGWARKGGWRTDPWLIRNDSRIRVVSRQENKRRIFSLEVKESYPHWVVLRTGRIGEYNHEVLFRPEKESCDGCKKKWEGWKLQETWMDPVKDSNGLYRTMLCYTCREKWEKEHGL